MPPPCSREIRRWAAELGFARIGVANIDLAEDEAASSIGCAQASRGEMRVHEPARQQAHPAGGAHPGHGELPQRAHGLLAGAGRGCAAARSATGPSPTSRATRSGRDYHKLMRHRLQKLCDRIAERVGPFGYRAFVDSAPVLEKALARNAGLGWIGKHTNLIDRNAGSYFFHRRDLSRASRCRSIPPSTAHCGTCSACLPACPTGAIVAPYRLDARRCISYLTIELAGPIPVELRRAIGNRIYGCDDCQLVCPWNKFARPSAEKDFEVRHGLDRAALVEVFAWSEAEFLEKTRGSAIRRIGFERWLRNVAVALGNAPTSPGGDRGARVARERVLALVREHVAWALAQHAGRPRGCQPRTRAANSFRSD